MYLIIKGAELRYKLRILYFNENNSTNYIITCKKGRFERFFKTPFANNFSWPIYNQDEFPHETY